MTIPPWCTKKVMVYYYTSLIEGNPENEHITSLREPGDQFGGDLCLKS